jgi:hypothetical protein
MAPDNQETIEDFINNIALNIRTGKVIPIVGYDFLLDQYSVPESERDFLKALIKIHARDPTLELRYPRAKTGGDLINEYYHDLDDNERPVFKLEISETIQQERIAMRLIPESYRKLVSIRCFNLFINATMTNSLELAMNAYRGEGNTEDAIRSSYTVFNYDPNHPDDLPTQAPPRNFRVEFEKPVIYNLFGTHDKERGEYILTDSDYIELIYDLIKYERNKFSNLLSYLNAGYLLFLGCNFPDWFFRFFIRVCVGDRLDSEIPMKGKTVIDTLNSIDPSRTVFIDQYQIRSIEMDCNLVIDKLFEALKDTNCLMGGGRLNNKVFISYCRADEDLALAIARQLKVYFVDYFLDSESLSIGDDLGETIKWEIDNCCLFLPIVSTNIQRSSPYVWREWNYAVDTKEDVWPIYREFVDTDVLAPVSFKLSDRLRPRILNPNNTLGIEPGKDDSIPMIAIKKIKERQYLSRVSGKKTTY